jgi:hypothetical protein
VVTDPPAPVRRREHRWPPAVAVLALVCLPLALPDHLTLRPGWLLLPVGVVFAVVLLAENPARDTRGLTVLRPVALVLTALFIVAAAWMTWQLTVDLVRGGPTTSSGSALLASGALVWLYNNVLFGLLYWEVDTGGPVTRAVRPRPHPDLLFPQQVNPQLAAPSWRPVFADYLYLGLTNALAFSPTDVMPLALTAKALMALQSLISFVIVGLVIARAVNVLT